MLVFLKNTKSTLIGLIGLAYIGLFLSIAISNITIIVLLAFCLVKTTPKEFIQALKRNSFPKIMAGLYLLLIIGLLYTSNYKTGFFILEKKISLLLIPLLLLPLLQKVNITDSPIYKIFGYITMISSVVLLCIGLYHQVILQDPQAFFFENFTSASVHYVYYSMYFSFGSLLLINELFDPLVKKRKGVLILSLLFVYSLSFLILVASKTGIIVFGLASIVLLYKKIENKKIFGFSLAVLLISASLVLYFNETTRKRFTDLSQNLSILTREELGDWREETITGLNMRLLFWKISVAHSWHDHLILTGTGTGDAQDYLNSIYTNPQYKREGYIGWDSHNEWVFTFIQLGLLGIISMALLYVKYLKEAVARNDLRLVLFLIITLGFSQSESILESNKGIVFFSLVFTLLCASYDKKLLPA